MGFIAGVWINGQLIEFTTYNSTKLRKSYADQEKVQLVMENRKYLLEIHAHRGKSYRPRLPDSRIYGWQD
ncbi:MAG: hypothetical protein R2778_08915 [Saprospiraceae bacterium]